MSPLEFSFREALDRGGGPLAAMRFYTSRRAGRPVYFAQRENFVTRLPLVVPGGQNRFVPCQHGYYHVRSHVSDRHPSPEARPFIHGVLMFLGFGELMMRLAPPNHLRFRQAMPGSLDVTFAGAEANVCASLALLGAPVRYLTALPSHEIADRALGVLRGLGVETDQVLRRDGRLGIYFVETGANRAVRSSSTIATTVR